MMILDAPTKGTVTWQSPSNIALVKYWGKYGVQLPRNASVSFTLSHAYTKTSIRYTSLSQTSENVSIDFLFEGKKNEKFENKITQFLNNIVGYFPFLTALHLSIKSENSFPHSTGIASSASSMSALALCLCQIEKDIFRRLENEDEFYQKASFIARLGSGSACRSVYPYLSLWGQLDEISTSSNEYAIPCYEEIHPVFKTFRDSILIVSAEEKSVSSRAGHALMEGNPYAEIRYKQAHQNVLKLLHSMKEGNLASWGEIVEKEALTLHALMMASEPPYILMQANTITMINKIQRFRQETNTPVYFTLDAGPNIHLLYPEKVNDKVMQFICKELVSLCENKKIIHDQVGFGPEKRK